MGISILLWNCEKEHINIFEAPTNSKTPFETISFESAIKQEEFNEIAKISKTEKYFIEPINNSKKSFKKASSKNVNAFKVIKKSVKKIKKENYTSYTFLIQRDNDDYQNSVFENLVVEKRNDEVKAFIIKYEPSLEYLQSKNLPFSGVLSIHNIDYDSSFLSRMDLDCGWKEIYTRRDCSVHGYDGVNIPSCVNYGKDSFVYSSTYVCSGGDGGTPFGGDDTPPSGDGGSQGDGSITSPVFPCDDPIHGCLNMPWMQLALKLNITDQNQIAFLESNKNIVEEMQNFIDLNNSIEAKNLAKEIIIAGNEGALISFFPFFKYPTNSNYATLYPKLTEYLKNKLPNVADIPLIVNTINDITGVSITQIKFDLQWNQGPIIKIIQLDNYASNTGTNTVGAFDKDFPDTLFLDIDYVNGLENNINEQFQEDGLLFYLGVSILHEYVHLTDNSDGTDYPGEEGQIFELKVYGANLNSTSAQWLILNKYY